MGQGSVRVIVRVRLRVFDKFRVKNGVMVWEKTSSKNMKEEERQYYLVRIKHK